MSQLRLEADPGALERYKHRHVMAFERARQEVIAMADRLAPRKHGRLAASITGDGPPRRTSTGLVGAFGSSERHAAMREFGGTIRPTRKKALSWISDRGIRIVLGPGIRRKFAKRDERTGELVIFIPGTGVTQRPGGPRQRSPYTPYLRPAADTFAGAVTDHLKALGD